CRVRVRRVEVAGAKIQCPSPRTPPSVPRNGRGRAMFRPSYENWTYVRGLLLSRPRYPALVLLVQRGDKVVHVWGRRCIAVVVLDQPVAVGGQPPAADRRFTGEVVLVDHPTVGEGPLVGAPATGTTLRAAE